MVSLSELADTPENRLSPSDGGRAVPVTVAETLYVATTGDDDDAGTIGAPFATIQKAVDTVVQQKIPYKTGPSWGDYLIRIKVADGTYTDPVVLPPFPAVGPDPFILIEGNTSTWDNVVVKSDARQGSIVCSGPTHGRWVLKGLSIDGSDSDFVTGLFVLDGGVVQIESCNLGPAGATGWQMAAQGTGSKIIMVQDITVDTGANEEAMCVAFQGGEIVWEGGEITFNNDPGYSGACVQLTDGGKFSGSGNTFVGANTARKYLIDKASRAHLSAYASFDAGFPGSANGKADRATSILTLDNLPANVIVAPSGYTIASHTAYLGVVYENGAMFSNRGASALAVLTLPAARVGMEFSAVVEDSDGWKLLANGTDVIRNGASASAAGGYAQNTTVGSMAKVSCHVAGLWHLQPLVGTWPVT